MQLFENGLKSATVEKQVQKYSRHLFYHTHSRIMEGNSKRMNRQSSRSPKIDISLLNVQCFFLK